MGLFLYFCFFFFLGESRGEKPSKIGAKSVKLHPPWAKNHHRHLDAPRPRFFLGSNHQKYLFFFLPFLHVFGRFCCRALPFSGRASSFLGHFPAVFTELCGEAGNQRPADPFLAFFPPKRRRGRGARSSLLRLGRRGCTCETEPPPSAPVWGKSAAFGDFGLFWTESGFF